MSTDSLAALACPHCATPPAAPPRRMATWKRRTLYGFLGLFGLVYGFFQWWQASATLLLLEEASSRMDAMARISERMQPRSEIEKLEEELTRFEAAVKAAYRQR